MFETIFIGTSSLLNHAKGLRVVGNNLANVNTPGFKSSQLQFSNLFERGGASSNNSGGANYGGGMGTGVTSIGTQISFRAGLDQSTGNPLDVNINGNGFFVINRDGETLYTRAGDFRFDADGILVNATGDKVQGLDSGGKLVDITIDDLARSMPKATANVLFQGNLTSTVVTPAVPTKIANISVIDANGTERPISLTLTNNGDGNYTVAVTHAGAPVATGQIKFVGGFPVAGSDALAFAFTPPGGTAFNVKLDFSKNVTSLAAASTLGVTSQDGYAAGVKTDQTIEPDGTIKIQYSNGQTALGQRIALADFKTDDALVEAGGGAFERKMGEPIQLGYAGNDSFGKMVAGHREGSNVDLAEEFGNLILMQRGYQAASHVVSTANEMIQTLFDMKGR